MMTESIHTPFLQDRYAAITGADYVFSACRSLSSELQFRPDGRVVARAQQVLKDACELLEVVASEGLFAAISRGVFADVKRPETGGRGLEGVIARHAQYRNPILQELTACESP